MEPSRVVEILQDGKSRGSGYLVTPLDVLTARHVAKPGSVGTVCMVHPLRAAGGQARPPAEARPQPVPAGVGWVSAKHDLALIKITGGPLGPPDAATIPLGEVPDDGVALQIVGSGFPAAAGADQRTIIGTLTWVLTGRRRFDIDVISAIPREWTKWGGFSGAAIFADNLLVGVVRTVDENWNGGVLEATPAVWLLEDTSFEEYFAGAKLSMPDRLDAGAVDRIMPLDFEANVSIEGTLRFSPRNPHVPFLGREAELVALDEFLTAQRRQPFAWWLVTGGGGAGKTRLARELCLRARRRGWRAGFLPGPFKADMPSLDAWCPRTSTLIVADYVMKRIEEIRMLAARLGRRDGLPPIRLLLLERAAGKLFENQFFGSDQSDRGVIEHACHKPVPLSLPELTDDQVWALVEACPWRTDAVRVPLNRIEFFQRLGPLDSQHRPLMAMILADALATSINRAGLGGLETVLQDLLRRDRDHLWPKELGVANAPVGNTEADLAIAFATMVDGLGPPELEAIKVARGKPIDPAILPACGIAIGKSLGSVPRLGRLEPDLIGEFFALETLRGDPNNPFAEPAHSWMPKTAWRARGSAMLDFVRRAKQTFPGHAAIQQVAIEVEGVRESWRATAVAIILGANDLTAGFDGARTWLLPHARLDAAAALTFVDLTRLEISFNQDPPLLIALSEALVELLQVHSNEHALREPVAAVLLVIGTMLGELGRKDAAIAVYDDVVKRFGAASELPLRKLVGQALVNKGFSLGMLDRRQEEIEVYDDVVKRFGAASELPLRELVGQALFEKVTVLHRLGAHWKAIEILYHVVKRFGKATELPLRELVAKGLIKRGDLLDILGRSKEAIAVYDDVVKRFGAASELSLREQVATALFKKGSCLSNRGRKQPAIAVYDNMVGRFGAASEPALREVVARASALRNSLRKS